MLIHINQNKIKPQIALNIFCEFILNCLSEKSSLVIKELALNILPNLYAILNSDQKNLLNTYFISIITSYPFPSSSNYFLKSSDTSLPNTAEFKSYCSISTAILNLISVVDDPKLIEVLLLFLKEEEHIFSPQIAESLEKLVQKLSLNDEKTKFFFQRYIDIFLNASFDSNVLDNARHFLIRKVFLPLLSKCSFTAVQIALLNFGKLLFEKYVLKYEIISGVIALKGVPSDDDSIDLFLLDLTLVFEILSIFYARCNTTTISNSTGLAGKEMIQKSAEWAKNSCPLETKFPDTFRKLRNSAYSLLVNCFICTQQGPTTKVETVNTILLKGKDAPFVTKIWENVIDLNKTFNFNFDFKTTVVNKFAELENLKPTFFQIDEIINTQYFGEEMKIDNVNYNNSTFYICLFYSILDSSILENNDIPIHKLNLQNQFMNNVLKIIDYCVARFNSIDKMPLWMESILEKFKTTDFRSIKWFIVRIILNRVRVFAPFAAQWFTPITEFVCDSSNIFQKEEILTFHYLVLTLSQMFCIDWKFLPHDIAQKSAANSFVSLFLDRISFVGEENNYLIISTNLQLFFELVVSWKSFATVNFKNLFKLLLSDGFFELFYI